MSKAPAKTPTETPPPLAPLPNSALAFCDGACKSNPGKGGFGTVIILPNGEQTDIYGGETHTTNNRMELMGAIMALSHSPPELPLQIWTDSGYVKDGITQWIAGWKRKNWKDVKNVDLWQQLDQARQNRQVTWHWLKGHAGHEGNEYADVLANLGVTHLPTPLTIKKKHNPNPFNAQTNVQINAQNPMTNNDTHLLPQTPNNPPDDLMNVFFSDTPPEFNDMDYDDYQENFTSGNNPLEPNYPQNNEQPTTISQPQHSKNSPHPTLPINPLFQNEKGIFFAQSDKLINQRPTFDGNTQTPNLFLPLLPLPKNHNVSNRQLIMDTETTGFEATGGDRIIEIGIVELINRKPTGEKLHVYINPHKEMDEEVIRIHGITNEFLADKPSFEQVGKAVYDFMQGAELVAHNAPFDMGFLVAEFERMGLPDFASQVTVTDSLVIAKQQYAGQRNTLDALVKRLNVGKQDRTFHGALLDAEILAEVFLAMTGGQVSLGIDDSVGGVSGTGEHRKFNASVARFMADEQTEQQHLEWINALKDKNPALLERWGLAEKAETQETM